MSYDFIVGAGHTPSGTTGCGAVGTLDESNCTRQIAPLVVSTINSNGKSANYIVVDQGNSGARFDDCYTRIDEANQDNCGLYVEIHLNAGGGTGVEVLVGSDATSTTRGIASAVCQKVAEAFGYTNRGIKEQRLIIFSNAKVPAILIECGFVDSSDADIYDAQKYASAIASALLSADVSAGGNGAADNTQTTEQVKAGWNQDAIGWWYCTDVTKKTYYKADDGWKYITNAWFRFDVKGYAYQNTWFQDSDGKWYFFDNDCKMIHSTWLLDSDINVWYRMNDDGFMETSKWIGYKSFNYYIKDNGKMACSEWVDYGGHWYYLNDDGKMAKSQLITHNDKQYYLDEHGFMVSNTTIEIDGKKCTFDEDGIMTEQKDI